MDDTAKLVAIILLASFAIERITAAVDFMLDGVKLRRAEHAKAKDQREKRQRKIVLASLSAILALAAVAVIDIRILRVLGFKAQPVIDFAVTWLVLFAGADKVRDLFQGGDSGSGGVSAETQVFEIKIHDRADIREIERAS